MNDPDDPDTRSQTPDDVQHLAPPAPAAPIPQPQFGTGDTVPGLSSWVLERKLGGGGFGEVWLARHAWDTDQKARAVKFCTDPEARHRLVTHEKNVVLRVMKYAGKHPNVVPLLDCNLDGDTPWLMYEFVEGGILASTIAQWRELPLPKRLGRAVRTLHAIAGALGTFHRFSPPLVHRDMKPHNILMAGSTPRITDFGIGGVAVKSREDNATGTLTEYAARLPSALHSAGTRIYAPPEQLFGSTPDPRDDVYALGIIAYQMVMADLNVAPGADAMLELRDLKVPSELVSLIANSVAMNADRRPKDASEWESALGALIGKAQKSQSGSTNTPATSPKADSAPLPPPTERPPARTERGPVPSSPTTRRPVAKPVASVPAEPLPIPEREPGEVVAFPLPGGLKMAFCWIPPGTAQLGSPLAEQNAVAEQIEKREDWLAAESELRRGVYTSKGFWLAKYPVTQSQWYALFGETPSYFQAGAGGAEKVKGVNTTQFPVEQVSWDMSQEFLKKINARGGLEAVFGEAGAFALPHEDAWEYACRGGLGNKQPFYFGTELNGTQANIDGNLPFATASTSTGFKGRVRGMLRGGTAVQRPMAVGSYEAKVPHPWSVCDMHGNVWEWCENSDDENKSRVIRGGSWHNPAHQSRSAFRSRKAPDAQLRTIGFRLCVPAAG